MNKMRTDQRSVFISERWKKSTDIYELEPQLSGAEAYSLLEIGENRYELLQCIYRKIRHFLDNARLKVALDFAIKAMIDTLG